MHSAVDNFTLIMKANLRLQLKGFVYYYRLQFQNRFDFILHALHLEYLIGVQNVLQMYGIIQKGDNRLG